MEFTSKEIKWLEAANKLFKRMPKDLMLYTCDVDIVVCKRGADSSEENWKITNSDINACTVIRDVHDDMGYGI